MERGAPRCSISPECTSCHFHCGISSGIEVSADHHSFALTARSPSRYDRTSGATYPRGVGYPPPTPSPPCRSASSDALPKQPQLQSSPTCTSLPKQTPQHLPSVVGIWIQDYRSQFYDICSIYVIFVFYLDCRRTLGDTLFGVTMVPHFCHQCS